MKKRLSLIILLAAVSIGNMAQTLGEAFYIYRNDGQFNAFFRDEVQSIEYSNYDVDSVYYDEIVTQVVNTADSVYKIPLAAIDSVAFVTPETKYRPNVIVIEGNIRNYVLSSEGLNIRFKSDIPSDLLPRKGDKLVTTEMSDTFIAGFAGLVENVENDGASILITCSSVGLEEIFEEFYFVNEGTPSTMMVRGEKSERRASWTWEDSYSPGEFSFPLTVPIAAQFKPDPKGDLAYVFEPDASVNITPTYSWKTVLVVSPLLGTIVSIDLKEDDVIAQNLSLSGAIDWTHDFTPGTIPIFGLGPFVYAYGEIGAFLRATASVSLEQHWKQNFRYTLHYEASSPLYIPRITFNGIRLENEHSGQLLANGEFGLGFYVELGVAFMAKWLLSAGGRAEAGIKVGGDVMLYKKDMESALRSTDVYKTLQGTDVHLSRFWNVGLQGQLLNWGFSHNFKPLSDEKMIARFSIVPDFSNVELERDETDSSILHASAKASGVCLPQDLGFTLFNQEIWDDGKTSFSRYGYMGSTADIYASYFDMPYDEKYEVYPTVKLFGVDALTILAEPKAKEKVEPYCPNSNHPHWIDLGLPSGTQWQCCNEGASTPEDYGGYYSFKHIYFDAPSLEQINELLDNTTSEWTTLNGVTGRKFIGSNGGTIFLPAAGYSMYDYDNYFNRRYFSVGSEGRYWSSTLSTAEYVSAYGLDFNSDDAIINHSVDVGCVYCVHLSLRHVR